MVGIEEIRNCLMDIGVLKNGINVSADESLFDLDLLDSLGFMTLVGELQTRFNIQVPELDLLPDNFDTINAIAKYVNQRKHEVAAN